jgi:predicted TIM-barrel fold metal-dependent hydrolase
MPTKLNKEWAIYNCHIHTFTRKNVPKHIAKIQLGDIAGSFLSRIEGSKSILKFIIWLLTIIQPKNKDMYLRLKRFANTGTLPTQKDVFEKIQTQYPSGTKFIILPMNMMHMGSLGNVEEAIQIQHADLLTLAKEANKKSKQEGYGEVVYPFYTVHPEETNIVKDAKKYLGKNKFRGIKIYPNLGYHPNNEILREIYKICEDGGFPVMSHCSPTGVWKYGLTDKDRRAFGQPENYRQVLEDFPKLRLCLAHFGSADEWILHLKGKTPDKGESRAWVRMITDLINEKDKKGKQKYPNLYTDISYTIFMPRVKGLYIDLVDYLKVLLSKKEIREHVLFGSDYYMVEQEEITEKEASILLRSRLGEDLYKQIAHTNPKRYLGIK